jgi:hypothetical protein
MRGVAGKDTTLAAALSRGRRWYQEYLMTDAFGPAFKQSDILAPR